MRHLQRLSIMLPLFEEKAETVSLMKHGLDVQKKATEFLTRGKFQ